MRSPLSGFRNSDFNKVAFGKIAFDAWTAPLALLVLCLLSYGVLIPWLGFYWDDWPSIWFLHLLGPDGFREAFSIDRPLLAWIFMLTTRLVGESTTGWQLFGVFTRWLTCVTLWWTLRLLWPDRPRQATWIAMLFAVYPGFSQQYISVTYSNAFLVFSIYLASFGAMILAVRRLRWFWPLMIVSWGCSALGLFITEYFFGLELLRPVVLWLVLDEGAPRRRRVRRVFLYWLPYLVITMLFLVWRVVLSDTPRGKVQIFDQLRQAPWTALRDLLLTITQDLVEVSLIAWGQVVNFSRLLGLSPRQALVYALIVAFTAVLAIFYLARLRPARDSDRTVDRRWAWQAIFVGGYALIFGGWPFWATYLQIKLRFPLDRFTMAMMIGVSILLVGLLELWVRNQWWKVLLIGAALGLAAGLHFQIGLDYRQAWELQKDFFWQLAWRAPRIQPGTLLLAPGLPFVYYSDNSLTAPLNWTYAPEGVSGVMPYLMFDLEARLGSSFTQFERGIPISHPYRAFRFEGSTSQVLAFFFDPPRCLTVIDPLVDQLWPKGSYYVPEALALSDPGLIDVKTRAPARPPGVYFDSEPGHGWCYFFQKADLARQAGDWDTVAALGNQALAWRGDLGAVSAIELAPFVEGYARSGQWAQALEWSRSALALDGEVSGRLCVVWLDALAGAPPGAEEVSIHEHLSDELRCDGITP